MKSSAKIVEQIRKALADPESVKYDALKAIAKEYGEACNRLNLGLTKAVVYYSTGNYSEAARILKEGHLLNEYQTLLFPELEAWRDVCQMFGWEYTAYVSTVNGEKLKKFVEEYERKADRGQGAVDGRSKAAVSPLGPVATPLDNSFSGSGAPGREPLPYLPKDDVFFTDSSAAAVEDESRVSNDSFSHPYLPSVHRKSKLVLSFPWIVVGGAVLTFFVFMCWILTGDKESNNPTSISSGTEASKQEPSIGAEPKKEATVDISANSESGRAALPEDVDVRGESARRSASDSVEEQVKLEAENGVVPEVAGSDIDSEERVQGDVNPNVVELEEQWNQLREENDFKQIVLFVASLSREIIGFDDKLSNFEICETFLESYEERNSHSLESVTKLCGGVEFAKVSENVESWRRKFEDFDLELFKKKCEITIEGMERVKELYRDAYLYRSLKDRENSVEEMNAIVSNNLFFRGEKTDFNGSSYQNIERHTDRLKQLIDGVLELSKTEEFDKELRSFNTVVSDFPEMRRTLEQEILTFIVQTVNSENSFSTFTGNLKGRKKVPVKFEDTRHELFVWDHIGEDKTSTFGEGMWAYVNYCAGSQNQWVCGLTFAFNKTDEIDAQDKTVVFIPGSKDGEVFNVNVKGKPVSIGVKMSSKDWRGGNLDFYISDPVSIPAILRSARVSISFTSRSDPESASFKSDFCQLLKPIDMTQTVDIESDKFLMNCAFISESDYNKLDKSAKKSPVNRKADSETGNVLCVVACDRKNKIEDKTGLFSLKLDVTDSLGMNSDKASKTDEGTRILLLFSRQTDNLKKDYEGATVVYRRVYGHGIFNALRRFSSYYEGSWALVDEKTLSSDSSDIIIDEAFKLETLNRWEQEFGTGNLLFYLVHPDYDVPRENWILYGKAPYRVFE